MPSPTSSPRRALVLGAGGHTGIAWEVGIIEGLLEQGVDVRDADLLIGSSAGSVVATHLARDRDIDEAIDLLTSPAVSVTAARMGPGVLARYAAAGLRPGSPSRNRSWLASRVSRSPLIDEEDFVEAVGHGIDDDRWPDRELMITAVRADTGEGVAFTKDSGVPLTRAVAASCSVPLIYPAVTIHGDRYIDGGLRTLTNADMARGADRVLVIAPLAVALRKHQRPRAQLAGLGPHVRSTCVVPDRGSLDAIGRNLLDPSRVRPARVAGKQQGARQAEQVARIWSDAR